MNNKAVQIIKETVKRYNEEEVITFVSQNFQERGFNKSTPNLFFANTSLIGKLSTYELICLSNALHTYSREEDVNPKLLFTKEELEDYETSDNIPYVPTSVCCHRVLDDNDESMLEFLNSVYKNYQTKETYYFLYNMKIKPEELDQGMGLGDFNSFQIVNMMQNMKGSVSTRRTALSLIEQYLAWYWRKDINSNPMLEIDKNNTTLIVKNKKQMSTFYISTQELQEKLSQMVKSDNYSIVPLDAMVASLIRDGITVRQLSRLKYDDFNFDKGMVKIKDVGIRQVKLSSESINWVKVCRSTSETSGNNRMLWSVDGHIIKVTTETYTYEQGEKAIRTRLAKFKKGGLVVNENSLINSKKVDMLDAIVANQGCVKRADFEKVQQHFGLAKGSWHKLRTDYEAVRGASHIRMF